MDWRDRERIIDIVITCILCQIFYIIIFLINLQHY